MDKLDSTKGPVNIQLKRPSPFSPSIVGLLFGIIGAYFILLKIEGKGIYFRVFASIFCLILFVIVLLLAILTRKKNGASFELKNNTIIFPIKSSSKKLVETSYDQISLIDTIKNRTLVVGIGKKIYSYPTNRFVDKNSADLIKHSITKIIKDNARGDELLCKISNNNELFKKLASRKVVSTILVTISIVVVYIAEYLSGLNDNYAMFINLGANASVLVNDGQWFRLITASLLHAGPLHLFSNLMCILTLGAALERLIGAKQFTILYIISAVGGGVASTLTNKAIFSVGASPAAFGLLGALAFLNIRFRGRLPFGYEMSKKWWVFVIGINAILPVMVPQIDIGAHIGGFFIGAAATWIMYFNTSHFNPLSTPGRTIDIVLILVASLSAVGIIKGISYSMNVEKGDSIRVIREYATSSSSSAEILNSLAEAIHSTPRVSLEELQIARTAAGRAVDAQADNAYYINTLAVSNYLLNECDEAIKLERMIFEDKLYNKKNKHIFAKQMARFLATRTENLGPFLIGDASPDDINIRINKEDQSRQIIIELSRLLPGGFVAYALVSADGQPVGVLRVSGGGADRMTARFSPPSILKKIPDNSEFNVAVIDASGCNCKEWKINFYQYSDQVSSP